MQGRSRRGSRHPQDYDRDDRRSDYDQRQAYSPSYRRQDDYPSYNEYNDRQYESRGYYQNESYDSRDSRDFQQTRGYHSHRGSGSGSRWRNNNAAFDNSYSNNNNNKMGYGSEPSRGYPSSYQDRAPRDVLRDSPRNGGMSRDSPLPRRGRNKKEDFVPHLPPAAYVELSCETPAESETPSPKLVVLDLNGAMLYRTERNSTAPRRSYPRPYLHNFLAYLMTAEPNGEVSPYEVLVWSSAQPQNVKVMVESTFGPWCDGIWGPKLQLPGNEKRLLDVWARDKMDLGADYNRNVQTTKDLKYVIAKLGRFDERTVMLVDDSPNKATEQPWSQIVVPDYDKKEYQRAKAAAARQDDDMDNALLAAVGIFEAIAHQISIPAWVRRGGMERIEKDASEKVTLGMLPSAEGYKHWFNNPETKAFWVAAGKAALERKGIPLAHGITPDTQSTQSTPQPTRKSARIAYNNSTYGTIDCIAKDERITAEQRDILLSALDVLRDLGHGPTGEPDEEDRAHQQGSSDRESEHSSLEERPERDWELPPKPQEASDRKERTNDWKSDDDSPLRLASEWRPQKKVLKRLEQLTLNDYDRLRDEERTIQDQLSASDAKNPKHKKHLQGRLENVGELLDLVVTDPAGPRFREMVNEYRSLPNPPKQDRNGESSNSGNKREYSESTQGSREDKKRARHIETA